MADVERPQDIMESHPPCFTNTGAKAQRDDVVSQGHTANGSMLYFLIPIPNSCPVSGHRTFYIHLFKFLGPLELCVKECFHTHEGVAE